MDPNMLLWIGQILLGLAFVTFGYGHAFGFEQASARPRMGWMVAVGRDRMRIIGILEILGAIGLILPAVTRILSFLTPVAAACLAVLMALAIVFHARRPGEAPSIIFNVILGVIAALVAYGRFVVSPL